MILTVSPFLSITLYLETDGLYPNNKKKTMQIHNNTLIAECSTYDFKEMLERKKVKSWLKSVSAFRHEDKSGNGHVIVKNAFSFISIPLFIYDGKSSMFLFSE